MQQNNNCYLGQTYPMSEEELVEIGFEQDKYREENNISYKEACDVFA